MEETMALVQYEEVQAHLGKTAGEIVKEVVASALREEKTTARTVLWLVILYLKDHNRFAHEVREGEIAQAFIERKGVGRLIAYVNLATAGGEILAGEDMELWELFASALHEHASSGLDRSATIRNAVLAWRYAERHRGREEALERRQELVALLRMWGEMSYSEFRAITARRRKELQEAETYVAHQPFRASYQIYPILPNGTRDEMPLEVQISWHRQEHERFVRELIAILEEIAMRWGDVHLE